jgi:multimeric flavodoxin WrbA
MSNSDKAIIIFGSSRTEGNTMALLKTIVNKRDVIIINLANKNISYYDYQHHNSEDDFLPLIKTVVQYEKIIFASPVYWYSFSAQMKTFIDRLSDLLTVHKDLGRSLRNKKAYLVSSGSELALPRCFEEQFQLICEYLGMQYSGLHYCSFIKTTTMSESQMQAAKTFGQSMFDL